MYRDGDLNLRPEFQRYFRWDEHKKTRLIESLLLGIPLPPIFVNQDQDGRWDVIDGLQRLSTILEFVGTLTGEDGEVRSPLVLSKAKYLPSLDGKTWKTLDDFAQRLIKRAAIGVTIVLRESDPNSKYDLFERLNTGGAALSDQEIRNCLLAMLDPKYLLWIQNLAKDENFVKCLSFSEKQRDEQADLDLVVRYVVPRDYNIKTLLGNADMGTLFTDTLIRLISDGGLDMEDMEKSFRFTFDLLAKTMGKESFMRYNPEAGRFEGAWTLSAFEVLAVGIGHNYQNFGPKKGRRKLPQIRERAIQLWTTNEEIRAAMGRGVRPASRMKSTIALGRRLFSEGSWT